MSVSIIIGVIFIIIIFFILYFTGKEILCVYRNPFPVFHNGDKRFRDIKKYKTRSILKDIENYDN